MDVTARAALVEAVSETTAPKLLFNAAFVVLALAHRKIPLFYFYLINLLYIIIIGIVSIDFRTVGAPVLCHIFMFRARVLGPSGGICLRRCLLL
jgi:hypothetical protein